jgi:hypothetical protein
MARKQIPASVGLAAIQDRDLPTATRFLLQEIEKRYPGGAVELRVPPFGAIQCIEGMNHRRGTPPNVVELDPESFLALALGGVSWEGLSVTGKLRASGALSAELASVFPLRVEA